MKKSLFVLFMALQSTAAFASTQVLQCKGMESDELGEVRKPIAVQISIIRPLVNTLLSINSDSGASERAKIEIAGLPAIQTSSINITNLRKAINIAGYVKESFTVSAYVPVPSIGAEGKVQVYLSRVTADNEHLMSNLSCDSFLTNSF